MRDKIRREIVGDRIGTGRVKWTFTSISDRNPGVELAGLGRLTRYTPERLSKVWLILKKFTHKIRLVLGGFYLGGSEYEFNC